MILINHQIRKISEHRRSAMLSFLAPLLLLPTLTNADNPLLLTFCDGDEIKNSTDSQIQKNLEQLLQVLPDKTTSSSGFSNTGVGDPPDRVYGQALCRGDVNSTVCGSCIREAGQEIRRNCTEKDAITWYQYCQVRYSTSNFFKQSVYAAKFPETNSREKEATDPVKFEKAVSNLMRHLWEDAASDPSKRMFATGETEFSDNGTIYGLVQCTRDIQGEECASCCKRALKEFEAINRDKQGGIVVSRNCNIRFEMDRFYNATPNRVPYKTSSAWSTWKIWLIVLIACCLLVVLASIAWLSFKFLQRKGREATGKDRGMLPLQQLQELATPREVAITQEAEFITASEDVQFMDMNTIIKATDEFSSTNKLGQGGFGAVYKGVLVDGKEIAVKRLSRRSWQGLGEFRNEVILIARLQHRNLVRLLGCAIGGEETLLVYEFMPNRSLDTFIFDTEKRDKLDWFACFNIITGIARGLLYLHEDSRLRIIHRDLKPNNVLLDDDMVAKISDFGMARIFGENQNTANTKRVVGTYYMAPEYAMEGLFSVKSDVFSFGVILLEILSGKRNSRFHLTGQARTLLSHGWRLWEEGRALEFVDQKLLETGTESQIITSMHLGLMCVQEDPTERPPMSSVVLFLESQPVGLPHPKQPAFSVRKLAAPDGFSSTDPSSNHVTTSDILPR